jgi:hypothetical protein
MSVSHDASADDDDFGRKASLNVDEILQQANQQVQADAAHGARQLKRDVTKKTEG